MTRAALLPAGGDPFLLAYWLRHYREIWADEVDELRIIVNGQNEPSARAYIEAEVAKSPHARVLFLDWRNDHGVNLRALVENTQMTHVLFCEDDAFVRHPGVISSRFEAIERGDVDVIGTARGNATDRLLFRARLRFGDPPVTESGETGLSLYPCFLFSSKENIPPGHLGAYRWEAGDYIEPLDYTCEGEEAADTFTYSSWVMRNNGLRIRSEAAYRSDSAHNGAGRHNVDGGTNNGDAPWFHVGSLSSGYGCAFMSDMDPVSYENFVAIVRPKGELYDWEKRMSWWTRVDEATQGDLPGFHERYTAELNKFMRDVDADPDGVAWWRSNYDPLVTWAER